MAMPMNFGPDYVRAIAPYQGGKPISEVAREFGLDEARIVKLASNENPLGVPESAKRAMSAAMADLGRYPDSNGFDLKVAISAKFGVPTEWITLGNGSNDIGLAWTKRGVFAVFVRCLPTGDAGRRCECGGGCCKRLRPRPPGHACGDD